MSAHRVWPSADARQAELARCVIEDGRVTITDAAEKFSVSSMTIHRDLIELERQGIVHRFRGGASAQPSIVFESNIRYRARAMREEKQAIAQAARRLIEPGMSILLDEGTTTHALAGLLSAIAPLTVATNFLDTLDSLRDVPDLKLISLGGEFRVSHGSFIGAACVGAIERLNTDLVFLSTSAVGHGGAYHQEQEIVAVKRAMMAAGDRKILLVDHSKLDASALYRFADLREFDLLITDEKCDPDKVEGLRSRGLAVEVASFKPTVT